MLGEYIHLTKPRLLLMNVLVAVAVFVFASVERVDVEALLYMSLGLAGVIGSACVFNNIADRKLDTRMERTKNRAIASGKISPLSAALYACALLVAGIALLMQTHILALSAALVGFAVYVFVYTPLKPKTAYALYAGAVAGATPVLVGYAAGAHLLDLYAYGLFVILFLWQIPHFLAIARYRFDEYTAAGVPLLIKHAPSSDACRDARKIFHYSLVFLLLFCLILIVHKWMR